jgi:PqqD family protein of HPr-rel-A system
VLIDERFVRGDEPVAADVDGDVVLLDPVSGDFYGLRGVAARIWELIAMPQSVRSLVATLTNEYDVDEVTCTEQVERFVGRLADAGLIQSA